MRENYLPAEATPSPCLPFNLLCVDDDPIVSDALARCLMDYGIQVIRAYDGMQGFWMVLRDKPGAVISDLSMPNGNGIEMIECLRGNAETEFLPIIVLTGSNDATLRRRLRNLSVSAILEKPASPSEIVVELFLTDFFSDGLQREANRQKADCASECSFADYSCSEYRNS